MHLKSLKIFCDVVGQRSFSRAANENGITQSGASQVVHQLEERLDVKLIDRSKRPWVLTPEGEVYYRGVRKFVQQYGELEDEVRTLHKEVQGRVRVASIYSVGFCHMNQYVEDFARAFPQADVQLQYHHPRQVYELVERDAVDLGLVSYPKSSRTIRAIPWRDEPMVLVCSAEHELATSSSLELHELQEVRFVGFDRDLKIRQAIDRTFAEHGVTVNVVIEFDNIENIKRAIEAGSGIGVLPEPTVQREVQLGSLVAIPLLVGGQRNRFVRALGIIHRHGAHLSRTAVQFIQTLRATIPSASDRAVGATPSRDETSVATIPGTDRDIH